MHRAWLCFDILQEVFSYLAPRQNVRYNPWWPTTEHWQFQHCDNDLASAARVCRDFSNPALDVLWASLDSFLPLLRLFHAFEEKPFESSDQLITSGSGVANVRYYLPDDAVPDAAEWARFQQYAERVRSIKYSHGRGINPAVFMWLIGHNRGEPLLPRLQTLTWHSASPQNSELLDVLPPSLHHLELRIAPDATERDDTGSIDSDPESSLMVDPSEQLVRNILAKTPLLQTLGIGSANLQALAPIAEYPHIHKLVILGTPDLRALPTISSVEGLVELHIQFPWDAAFTLPRGFRNLQHLKWHSTSSQPFPHGSFCRSNIDIFLATWIAVSAT
ncbi:hypothetical protein B0H21DRAFT_225903 [Amylocystis lapponica]|nr:hypothetical protein B0H21DRAFT_225903 [Amylocystis lapponica]